MDIIAVINNIIQYFFFSLFTFYISKKILNCKDLEVSDIIISIVVSILLGITFGILSNFLYTFLILITILFIIAIVLSLITKLKLSHTILIAFLSMGLNFLFYSIAIFFLSLPTIFEPIYLIYNMELFRLFLFLLIFSLEYAFIIFFFTIDRFENRFCFRKRKKQNYRISFFRLLLINFYNISYFSL